LIRPSWFEEITTTNSITVTAIGKTILKPHQTLKHFHPA
jgi:hypothetical protein